MTGFIRRHNPFGSNVIPVCQPDDWGPINGAGKRELIPGKSYAICEPITWAETLIAPFNRIFDLSHGANVLTFTGPGTLFESDNMIRNQLDELQILATNPTSQLWDFDSSAPVSAQTMVRCVFLGFNSLGTIKNSTVISWSISAIANFNNGLVVENGNTHAIVNFTMSPALTAATTCIEWNGTWTDIITITVATFFARVAGSSVFDIDTGFTSPSPITGSLISINLSGGGVFLDPTGKDVDAPEVYFQINGFSQGTVTAAEAIMLNNTLVTTIATEDTPVDINGVFTTNSLNKFTISGQEFTYIGKKDITARLDGILQIEGNGANEGDTYSAYFYVDTGSGFVQLANSRGQITLTGVLNNTLSPRFGPSISATLKENDKIKIQIENNSTTQDATVVYQKINIEQAE